MPPQPSQSGPCAPPGPVSCFQMHCLPKVSNDQQLCSLLAYQPHAARIRSAGDLSFPTPGQPLVNDAGVWCPGVERKYFSSLASDLVSSKMGQLQCPHTSLGDRVQATLRVTVPRDKSGKPSSLPGTSLTCLGSPTDQAEASLPGALLRLYLVWRPSCPRPASLTPLGHTDPCLWAFWKAQPKTKSPWLDCHLGARSGLGPQSLFCI